MTQSPEIIFGLLLWSQKRAQPIQHARNTILAPKNTFELLLSAEIDQLEVDELNFLEILTFPFVETIGI